MTIGEKIRQRRLELGMTQTELADFMGYKDKSSIAKIEKSDTDLSSKAIKKLSDILQISITELMTDEMSHEQTEQTSITINKVIKGEEVTLQERKLLQAYRKLNDDDKRIVDLLVKRLRV